MNLETKKNVNSLTTILFCPQMYVVLTVLKQLQLNRYRLQWLSGSLGSRSENNLVIPHEKHLKCEQNHNGFDTVLRCSENKLHHIAGHWK